SEDEAADVREEGDAAAGLWVQQREPAVPELEGKPDAEEEEGRNLDEEVEDDREHARSRQQKEVRAEHAGDGAARPEIRDRTVDGRGGRERDHRLERGRREPRDQVEDEEAQLAQRVLDVVAEDPEEEH